VTITHGERHDTDVEQPPPFRIRYGDAELQLNPVTYCYTRGCVDGVDDDPPSVGSPSELFVFVPVSQFEELTVTQTEGGDPCTGRSFVADVEPLGDGWWSVRPLGPAGDYQVSIFASGGGDMAAELLWSTPLDGPLPEPSARLALIADHDGRPDSYGVELLISDLAVRPAQYAATITVAAANGSSLTFDAVAAADACMGAGAIYFDGPDDKGVQAAALGDFPFTMTVTLTLDETVHLATARYPDDEIAGNEPSVKLEFDPPLPG
jgi:hypothetical protein